MSKRAETWMPLYVADWDSDTRHLDCEQDGAYGRLVRHYWRNGPPLDDDAQLARVVGMERARWRKVRPAIAPFFEIRDGRWFHKRVEEELGRAREIIEKRRVAGAKGAEGRWGDNEKLTRSERLSAARKLATHLPEEWAALVAILGNRCVKCSVAASELAGEVLCKDHIRPIVQGGSDGIDNLQPLCRECNAGKGTDSTDHRQSVCPDWRERLAKCLAKRLANASQTPGPRGVKVDVSEITTSPSQELSSDSQGSGVVVALNRDGMR